MSVLMVVSCNRKSSKKPQIEVAEVSSYEEFEIQSHTEKIKEVFYVFPSPIELATLVKSSGVNFQDRFLNPVDNLLGYSSSRTMAINLGVYCADLSYASMFDQIQIALKYIDASKRLADAIGIMSVIDKDRLDLLEENINDKALILDLVSEIYLESREQLKEQDRYPMAVLILVGGWIESMYIATQLTEKNLDMHKPLMERVVDQRLSLYKLIRVLEDNMEDVNVRPILKDFKDLQGIFEKIMVNEGEITMENQVDRRYSIVKSETNYFVNSEVYDHLCVKIESIRNQFIQ